MIGFAQNISVSHTFNSVDEETAMKVNLVLIEKLDDAYIYSIYTMRSEILIIRFFSPKKERREALVVLRVCTCTARHLARDPCGGSCLVRRGILHC